MTEQVSVIPDAEAAIRWRDWQARGVANDRRTRVHMRTVIVLLVVAVAAWSYVQLG
jgi:hypothetical protein